MPSGEARYLKQLYWRAFALRFLIGCVGWFITFGMDFPLMEDAQFYEQLGADVAQDWLGGRSNLWLEEALVRGEKPWLMVVAIGLCYTLLGGLRALPVLIAVYCLLTAWVPVLTYRIARALGQPPASARVGARLVAYSPAFVFWAGALYKEGLILLALNLLVYHALLLQKRLRLGSLVVLGGCLAALLGLRFYLAVLAAVLLPVALLLGESGRGALRRVVDLPLRQGMIVALAVAVLTQVGYFRLVQVAGLPLVTRVAVLRIEHSRHELARFDSGYLKEEHVRTPEEALAFLPVGTLYFLTVPFPWQWGSLRQNLVIPETFFWLLLYPLVALGLWRGLRRQFAGVLLLGSFLVVLSLFHGLYVGNIGTAYRMRTQVWLFAAVFVGWGREPYRALGRGSPKDAGRRLDRRPPGRQPGSFDAKPPKASVDPSIAKRQGNPVLPGSSPCTSTSS